MFAPELRAQNHAAGLTALILPRRKGPAEHRADTQDTKKICAGYYPDAMDGFAACAMKWSKS